MSEDRPQYQAFAPDPVPTHAEIALSWAHEIEEAQG